MGAYVSKEAAEEAKIRKYVCETMALVLLTENRTVFHRLCLALLVVCQRISLAASEDRKDSNAKPSDVAHANSDKVNSKSLGDIAKSSENELIRELQKILDDTANLQPAFELVMGNIFDMQ